jgi:3-oxoacyl-[acyl-carrier-protein] synthase-3
MQFNVTMNKKNLNQVGINEIGFYIPNNYISNLEQISKFELDETFLKQKIGTNKLARKFIEQQTSDLCVKAFEDLENKVKINRESIDCLVLVTQNPDGDGLPHTSAIIHAKLNLSVNCAVFDISLGCSGYVYAISIIKSFMESNDLKNGLLFTCDPYSKIIDNNDKNTSMLFGDAATVTLFNNKPNYFLDKFVFATSGIEANSLICNNGILSMNGRSVFNFCATEVPKQIKQLIDNHNDSKEADIYLLHQGSKFIIDTIARKLNLDSYKVPCNIDGVGNTVSSSIPLLLKNYLHSSTLNTIILSGFGVGLSWASCILKINK